MAKDLREQAPGVGILPGVFRDHLTFMEVSHNPDTITYLKSELADYITTREIEARLEEHNYLFTDMVLDDTTDDELELAKKFIQRSKNRIDELKQRKERDE